MTMPLHPDWQDIAIRLILTMIAGGVIGLNRGAHGHAAGLRTTMLVGLAASLAMIQANILLSLGGKAPDAFGVMDLMRLPLGILTGVGFIGGGAILKRGDLITGVTTAATLWVMTVIGLCFGGGQIGLGLAGTGLSVVTLWVLKWLDVRIPRECRATVVISTEAPSNALVDLDAAIFPLGYQAEFRRQAVDEDKRLKLWFEIRWMRSELAGPPLDLLEVIDKKYSVELFDITTETRR